MVLWCWLCGASIGLRPPLEDWTVDRNGVCPSCTEREPSLTAIIERVIEPAKKSDSGEGKIIDS
jgi:hypothetical protein